LPEIMCSEVAELIDKGIMDVKKESDKSSIFEASLNISNVQKGSDIGTLKNFLISFKNEMYTERGTTVGCFHVHFYTRQRAKEAMSFIQNTPNQFSNCECVFHKKDIGTLGDIVSSEVEAQQNTFVKKKKQVEVDDDGFMTVV